MHAAQQSNRDKLTASLLTPLVPLSLFRRYEHALSKANYASLALRPEAQADEDEGAGLDEDEDLYQSLNK